MTQLWVRVGDAGDYNAFGDDFTALVDYLNELSVGQVEQWIDRGFGIGFITPNYHGRDLVSLFWGDREGNLVRPLNINEREIIETGLTAAYI